MAGRAIPQQNRDLQLRDRELEGYPAGPARPAAAPRFGGVHGLDLPTLRADAPDRPVAQKLPCTRTLDKVIADSSTVSLSRAKPCPGQATGGS